ncbi:trans-aconitate 2-methyltransferase-like [Ptychodera flava]|uniref:trans-aconitate 2-methyltransferase-like n=1 Tax=Ptychodera flava TaxID=63121 RepID=UPI00396A9622
MNIDVPVSSYDLFKKTIVEESARSILKRLSFKPGDTMLDVGCGPGTLTQMITNRANVGATTAFDVNEHMIKYARKNASNDKIKYSVGDANDLATFKCEWKNSFDKVVAYHVLHWIENWATVTLPAIYQCLKPGGECYVNIHPNKHPVFLLIIEDFVKSSKWGILFSEYKFPVHFLKGGERELVNILTKIGFKHIKCETEYLDEIVDINEIETAKDGYRNFVPHIKHLPQEMQDEFFEDAFQYAYDKAIKMDNGSFKWVTTNIVAVAKK